MSARPVRPPGSDRSSAAAALTEGSSIEGSDGSRHRAALAACVAAGFATLVDTGLLGIVTPALQGSLQAGTAQMQWVLASYSLTFGLALVPAGRLGDRYGRRHLFLAGITLFAVTSVVSGLAGAPETVVVARLLQGIGAGMISAQVLGVIQDLFVGSDRARALGAYGVGAGLAGVVGPPAGALLLAATDADLGWRLALLGNVPFALAAGVLGWVGLPRCCGPAPAGPGVSVDPVGLTTLGLATVLVMLPLVWTGGPVLLLLSAAAVALLGFVGWERRYGRRGRTPVLLPALARAPGYVRGVTVATFWFGASVGHGTVVSLYLIVGLGCQPLLAAAVMTPRALGFVLTSAVSWRLLVRFGYRVVPFGVAGQLAGTAALGGAALWAGPGWFFGTGFLGVVVVVELWLGLTHGLSEAPNRTVTLAGVPVGAAGLAAGFLQLTQRLAATLVVAATVGILLGAGPGPDASARALVEASAVVAGLLGVSLVAALRRERRHQDTVVSGRRPPRGRSSR